MTQLCLGQTKIRNTECLLTWLQHKTRLTGSINCKLASLHYMTMHSSHTLTEVFPCFSSVVKQMQITVCRWEREMHCLVVFRMPQTASETVSGRCNEQLAQFTTERQPVLRPAVAFSKTSFKNRSIQIKGNFTKAALHLYFNCVMYCAGLLLT